MANEDFLTDGLADLVTITVKDVVDNNPTGDINNDPSVFDVTFGDTPDYYLNEFGVYDGFCLQPWLQAPLTSSAELYYSTENFTIETLVDLDQDANVNPDQPFEITEDKIQESVYTLNNLTWENLDDDAALEGVIKDDNGNILNPTDGDGNIIYLEVADVQYLMWYQIYGLYAPDYTPGFDESPYGPRALNSAQNAALAASIKPFADNYVADQAGEKIGLILVPENNQQFIFSTVELSGLGDYVWFDSDGDGIQDDDEDGVEGVTVELLVDGEVQDTTTTDNTGFYSFDGIIADDYQVRFVKPNGFDFTIQNADNGQSNQDEVDSDADINTGLSQIISLTPGEFDSTIDAGLVSTLPPPVEDTAKLGDRVWFDENRNGQQDDGEIGVNGVTVNLKDANGETIETTTTANIDIDGDGTPDGDGLYKFDNLDPGTYSVQFVRPDNYDFTDPNVGEDNAIDSDALPGMNGMTESVTLTSGEFNQTLDAGLVEECVSVCTELPFTVNQNISGLSVNVGITLNEIEGGVEFNVSSIDQVNNLIGDIRAIFFNIEDDSLVDGLSVTGVDVTDSAFEANEIDKELGDDAIIKGGGNKYKYDAGVEIGTQGKSVDDIQETTFVISHATEELNIDDFLNQEFGVRLTSVGDPLGNREESSKLVGNSGEECIYSCIHSDIG